MRQDRSLPLSQAAHAAALTTARHARHALATLQKRRDIPRGSSSWLRTADRTISTAEKLIRASKRNNIKASPHPTPMSSSSPSSFPPPAPPFPPPPSEISDNTPRHYPSGTRIPPKEIRRARRKPTIKPPPGYPTAPAPKNRPSKPTKHGKNGKHSKPTRPSRPSAAHATSSSSPPHPPANGKLDMVEKVMLKLNDPKFQKAASRIVEEQARKFLRDLL